jgi:hypothetical protein
MAALRDAFIFSRQDAKIKTQDAKKFFAPLLRGGFALNLPYLKN